MLGLGLVMVLIVLLAAGAVLIQAAAAAGRAAAAADLAALAAADAARNITPGEPCRLAGQVSDRHGAKLLRCARSGASGEIVDVTTGVDVPALRGWVSAHPSGGAPGQAIGRSRAGPPP